MRKFLFFTFPFLFLIVLFGYIRFQFLAGDFADKRTFYSKLPQTKFSNACLVIGDSKSQFGFDDSLISNSINRNFFNLSIWGARPMDYLHNLKNHPIENSVIFIVISSRTFLEPDSMYKFHRSFSIHELFDFNLYSSARDYFLGNSNNINQGAWEYRVQSSGSLRFRQSKRQGGNYARFEDSVHQSINYKLFSDNVFIDVKIQHLKQLIDQIGKSSNRIFLISLPERRCYMQWSNIYNSKLFQMISDKTGLSVINFGSYEDNLFYDSHHLNAEGAKYFTTQFIQRFKGQL